MVAAVSALVCLTYICVVRECQYFAVGMLAMYIVYNISPKMLPCGTPTLMSFTSQYTSFIFTTKLLLLRYDLNKWWICSGKCFLIVCKMLSWFEIPTEKRLITIRIGNSV